MEEVKFVLREFIKSIQFFGPVYLMLLFVFMFKLVNVESQHEQYVIQRDIEIQLAESRAQVYKDEMDRLREENYIYYDQIRQITANAEAQRYLNGGE